MRETIAGGGGVGRAAAAACVARRRAAGCDAEGTRGPSARAPCSERMASTTRIIAQALLLVSPLLRPAAALSTARSASALPGTSAVEDQSALVPLGASSRVLVVGASRGIGLEFVRQLVDKGCDVVATHRSGPPAPLAALAESGGARLSFLQMDMADPESVEAAAAELRAREGGGKKLSHIVCNAGVYGPTVSLDGVARMNRSAGRPATQADLLEVFKVNAAGPFLVVQQFADLLGAEEGALPVVAVLTSKVGSVDDNASGGAYAYRASKAALNQIVKSLYVDMRSEDRATFVLLHPGYVRTDMTGGKGLIDATDSVAGMLRAIEATGPDTPFRFVAWDGKRIPW